MNRTVAFCLAIAVSFSVGVIFLSCTTFGTSGKTPLQQSGVPADLQISKPAYHKESVLGSPVIFKRIFGYVVEGREDQVDYDDPFTDIGYFSADVDCYGNLSHIPDRTRLSGFSGSVYLVMTCDSRSLTHFVIDPRYGVCDMLVAQMVSAAAPFDGIQIDFENVPGQDGECFFQFLKNLKDCLEGKPLSVCVPARLRTLEQDVYAYHAISSVVDSMVVMAYDEHWSSGEPGAVASMDWCHNVAEYALSQIPQEKLIMGIPLYGRSWGDVRLNRAWIYPSVNELIKKHHVRNIYREKGVPFFRYTENVNVICWFDDAYSIIARSRMYESLGIKNISFWRIGQEDPDIWQWFATRPLRN
jgi:spore germination protein